MNRYQFAGVFLAAILGIVCWESVQSVPDYDGEDADLYRLFVDAVEHVDQSYVNEVDRRKLIESAIRGMLDELDPYSAYIPPVDATDFQKDTLGKYGGIGIQVSGKRKDDPYLTIISPMMGTPAYEAGVLAGDRIVKVEGKDVAGMTQNDIIELLSGPAETNVTLTVHHIPFDKEPVDLTLMRKIIRIQSVLGMERKTDDQWNYYADTDKEIGYVRLTGFVETTADELKKVLEELKSNNIKGLIIDLRYNPGGLLTSAVDVSNFFLSSGVVVSTEGRNYRPETYHAKSDTIMPDVPIVVLINTRSASASEILSACLQDHERATIVGERSFGKGSVQNVILLDESKSSLKLTTAHYMRPSEKKIHRTPDDKPEDEWGVKPKPEHTVAFTLEQHRDYLLQLRDREIAQGKNAPKQKKAEDEAKPKGDENLENKEETKKEPFVDTQLQKALEVLNEKMKSDNSTS